MRLRRPTALAVIGLIAGVLVGAPAGGAAAAPRPASVPLSRCGADGGTIVAVDFAHWDGPVLRDCVVHGATAYGLLHAAGFTTAGDAHDGPGFICRLGDAAFRHGAQYPTAAQQSCVNTPSASAYWSSWVAPAGAARLRYSQLGASAEPARPGEVQLWTFGATNLAGSSGSGVPTLSAARLRGPATRAGDLRLEPASASASAGAATSTSPGSATGLIIGIAAAVALGGAAAVIAWRRGRSA